MEEIKEDVLQDVATKTEGYFNSFINIADKHVSDLGYEIGHSEFGQAHPAVTALGTMVGMTVLAGTFLPSPVAISAGAYLAYKTNKKVVKEKVSKLIEKIKAVFEGNDSDKALGKQTDEDELITKLDKVRDVDNKESNDEFSLDGKSKSKGKKFGEMAPPGGIKKK